MGTDSTCDSIALPISESALLCLMLDDEQTAEICELLLLSELSHRNGIFQ